MDQAIIRKPRKLKKRGSSSLMAATAFIAILAATSLAAKQILTKPAAAVPAPIIKTTAEDDMISVPTPARAVARGERLKDVEFVNVKWPKSQTSADYLTNVSDYREAIATTVLPKYVPVPVSALSLNRLDSNAVVDGIPEGMRAITVKADAESAVEGWARSGNFVDVIVIRNSADASVGLEAKVIAENVKILSAGRSTAPLENSATAPQAPATVTLLVTQEDALKIKTGANIGKLTFALRGSTDQSPALSLAMDQKRLLGSAKNAELAKPAAYKGFAQGPDGKRYVLTDGSRWLRQPEQESATKQDNSGV